MDISSVLNSNLAGLVISGLLAVGVASFIGWYSTWRNRNEAKRKTGILLGVELLTIKKLCQQNVKLLPAELERYRKNRDAKFWMAGSIGDDDLPRTIFDKPSTDLSLFSDRFVENTYEAYLAASLAKQWKDKANGFEVELKDEMLNLEKVRDINDKARGEERLNLLSKNFLKYADGYIHYIKEVLLYIDQPLDELKKMKVLTEETNSRPLQPPKESPSEMDGVAPI